MNTATPIQNNQKAKSKFVHAHNDMHSFTAQELEADFKTNYMGARFYDPDLGRFLQVDPRRQFWSGYAYGFNNPIIGVDMDGEAFTLAATVTVAGGMLTGGGAGAAWGAGTNAFMQWMSPEPWNWQNFKAATAGGFVDGSIFSTGVGLLVGGVVGGLVERSMDTTEGNTFNSTDILLDLTFAKVGEMGSAFLGKISKKTDISLVQAAKQKKMRLGHLPKGSFPGATGRITLQLDPKRILERVVNAEAAIKTHKRIRFKLFVAKGIQTVGEGGAKVIYSKMKFSISNTEEFNEN